MSFTERLRQIDELQQQINSYGKLPDKVLKKINYKFRLEWNYTSNQYGGEYPDQGRNTQCNDWEYNC